MIEVVSAVLMLIGAVFVFLSAIGIVKMPDLYTRMSATTKASTFGLVFILIGTSLLWGEAGIIGRSLIIILFLFFSAPIAAHIIGRAGYADGIRLYHKTKVDQMKEYDARKVATHLNNTAKNFHEE